MNNIKYVRLKKGIISDLEHLWKDMNGNYCFGFGYNPVIYKEEIIKESDNLEDLIDGYVVKKNFTNEKYVDYSYWFQDFKRAKIKMETYKKQGIEATIYGAIWTDKGLQYIAKMNSKGKLELL